MPKPCWQLAAELSELERAKLKSSLKTIAKNIGMDLDVSNIDESIAAIAQQVGVDESTVRSEVRRGMKTQEAKEAAYSEYEDVVAKAQSNADQMATPEGRKGLWENLSEAVKSGFTRTLGSVEALPVDKALKDALRTFGGKMTMVRVAHDTFTGAEEGTLVAHRAKDLFKSIKDKVGANEELFMESLAETMANRKSDDLGNFEGFDRGRPHDLLKKIQDIRKLTSPDFGVHYENILKKSLELMDHVEVRDFVDAEGRNLFRIGSKLFKKDVISKMYQDYFPNSVRMVYEDTVNPIEKVIFDQRLSPSDITKAKHYRSPVEAAIDGFMPTSFQFDHLMGVYHTKAGKRLSLSSLRDAIKSNAEKWNVQTHLDTEEKAFILGGDKEIQKETADGQKYINLGVKTKRLQGIYIHPILYRRWADKVFDHFPKEGFLATGFSINNMAKGLHFGFDFFHVATLVKKGVELGGSFGFMANPYTTIRGGLDALARHDPRLLLLAEQGTTFHKEQSDRTFLSQFTYDSMTGEKKVNYWHQLVSFGGLASKATDVIFHQVQPGLKAGIALKIMETKTFERWVEEGGADYAYKNLSSLLNNHFGGQNLVAMGRSNYAQAFFQAAMLAPDFQESMWRRHFGVIHPDKNLRAVYQASVGIQIAMVATMVPTLQALFDELAKPFGKKPRSAKSWLHDSIGHWMDIEVGVSDKGRKIYANPFGAEKEIFRPILSLFNHYYGILEGKDLTGEKTKWKNAAFGRSIIEPILKDLFHEARNKMSPVAREITHYLESNPIKAKKEPLLEAGGVTLVTKPDSMFDFPWMPISAQPAVYSAIGGFADAPEDRAKWAAASLITSALGTPLTEGRSPKKKPKPLEF